MKLNKFIKTSIAAIIGFNVLFLSAQAKDGKLPQTKNACALSNVVAKKGSESKNLYMVSVVDRLINVLENDNKFRGHLEDFYKQNRNLKKNDIYAIELNSKNVNNVSPNIGPLKEDIKTIIYNTAFIEDIKKPINKKYFKGLKMKMVKAVGERAACLEKECGKLQAEDKNAEDKNNKKKPKAKRKTKKSNLKTKAKKKKLRAKKKKLRTKKNNLKTKNKNNRRKLRDKCKQKKKNVKKCTKKVNKNLKSRNRCADMSKNQKKNLNGCCATALANYENRLGKLKHLKFEEYLCESKKIVSKVDPTNLVKGLKSAYASIEKK